MADPDKIAEQVQKRLASRLDALERKGVERQQLFFAETASLRSENLRKDAQIDLLISKNAAMERRLERLEQASRSNNITLSTSLKEKPSARPTGIFKDVYNKLPAHDSVHQRHLLVGR